MHERMNEQTNKRMNERMNKCMYSASGNANIRGAVEQVERALEEGELSSTSVILVTALLLYSAYGPAPISFISRSSSRYSCHVGRAWVVTKSINTIVCHRIHTGFHAWAARYKTWLLIQMMPKGVKTRLSSSWAVHVWPRALTVTSTYIMGKMPLACPAGGMVVMFKHHHKAFSRSWAKPMRPCALIVTLTYIIFKWPLTCLAGGKVIVFGHHHKVLDGIQQKLGKAYQAMRIDGSTSMEARKKGMDDFQQKASVRLAILSITAAGVSSQLYM